MGEVYRATDTRLGRTVAIKVLPAELASDPERRERFEREAKTISSLNHPHICTLYDVGHKDGFDFLVMEHLEGETLQNRLTKGALPLDQALKYTIEIADALDKAHRQGVVHRDLKPGNVMLTQAGAKLLDFGLAKLRASSGDDAASTATTAAPLTVAEGVLGTPQYMAPEQLENRDVDARTDLFALGAVAYEMIVGRRVFDGSSQASLIAAVLGHEPSPPSTVQPGVPAAADRAVIKCLAKDPDRRWQSARDLADELQWISETAAPAAAMESSRRRRGWVLALAAGAFVAGSVTTSVLRWQPTPDEPQARPARFLLTLSDTDALSAGFTLSPIGVALAYAAVQDGERHVYVRELDRLDALPIRGTEGGMQPFYSPDGQWIGYFTATGLRKVAATGGQPVTVCEACVSGGPAGASWGPDDTIVFASIDSLGLQRVSAVGGEPTPLTTGIHRWPEFLPDGEALVFTDLVTPRVGDQRIAVVSLKTGEVSTLVDGTDPSYLPSGHLLFARERSLWAGRFDPIRLHLEGEPWPVVEGVQVADLGGLASYAVGPERTLVYQPVIGSQSPQSLVRVYRDGQVQPLLTDEADLWLPRVAPDGRRLAIGIGRDIWAIDLERLTRTRLTFGHTTTYAPFTWTRDGESVTFGSPDANSISTVPADGSRPPEPHLEGAHPQWPGSWSPDGRTLAFYVNDPGTHRDLWTLSVSDMDASPFLVAPFEERAPRFSPDGRWLAYVSDESGRDEVYASAFPSADQKVAISTGGGREPVWSPDGTALFYRADSELMVVDVVGTSTLRLAAPRPLALGMPYQNSLDPGAGGANANYDVFPDSQSFAMIEPSSSSTAHVTIVLNWSAPALGATP